MLFNTRQSLSKVQSRGVSTSTGLQSLKPLRGMLIAITGSSLLLIGLTSLITGTDHVFAKPNVNAKEDSDDE